MKLDREGEQILLRILDISTAVQKLSDRELAQLLVEATEEMRLDSPLYNLLMEAAERICVELFDEADPHHPSFKGENK